MSSDCDKSLEEKKAKRIKYYKSSLSGMPESDLMIRLNKIGIINCHACHEPFVSDDVTIERHCQPCRGKVNTAVDQYATGFVGNERVKNGRNSRNRE